MYAREIEGREFTFGVSGKLVRNVLVMYDRETESYWSQLLGEAIQGEMAGTRLEFLPSWMTTWGDWKARHPDTLALVKPFAGAGDRYAGYYQSGQTGIMPETIRDDRLYVKEFVVGVELPGDLAKAYPFRALNAAPVVNDAVGEHQLLVVFNVDPLAWAAYDREVAGQLLTFSPGDEPWILTDDQTGTTWDGFSGEAIAGPLAGTTLRRFKSTSSFWFGWTDFHPDTLVYETPADPE